MHLSATADNRQLCCTAAIRFWARPSPPLAAILFGRRPLPPLSRLVQHNCGYPRMARCSCVGGAGFVRFSCLCADVRSSVECVGLQRASPWSGPVSRCPRVGRLGRARATARSRPAAPCRPAFHHAQVSPIGPSPVAPSEVSPHTLGLVSRRPALLRFPSSRAHVFRKISIGKMLASFFPNHYIPPHGHHVLHPAYNSDDRHRHHHRLCRGNPDAAERHGDQPSTEHGFSFAADDGVASTSSSPSTTRFRPKMEMDSLKPAP